MYNARCQRARGSGIVRAMAKGGFWDYQDYWKTVTSGRSWFDAEWKQRRDINDLETAEAQTAYDVSSLQVAIGQMQKKLLELSVTTIVMAQVLEEAKLLDLAQLHARIDAELENLRPKPAPMPQSPPEPHPTKAKPLDTPVACGKCGTSVPSSRTTITERYGTVCDRCAESM